MTRHRVEPIIACAEEYSTLLTASRGARRLKEPTPTHDEPATLEQLEAETAAHPENLDAERPEGGRNHLRPSFIRSSAAGGVCRARP